MDMTEESLLDRHIHLHTHELLPGRWLRPRRRTLLITHRFKEAPIWPIIHRRRKKPQGGEKISMQSGINGFGREGIRIGNGT